MLLEHRKTGARGLAALPHRAFWLQLHGLVQDGVQFSRSRLDKKLGGRLGAGYRAVPPPPPAAPPDGVDDEEGGRGKKRSSRGKPKARSSKGGKGGRASKGDKGKGKAAAEAEPAGEGGDGVAGEETEVARRERLLREEREGGVHSSQQKIKVTTFG